MGESSIYYDVEAYNSRKRKLGNNFKRPPRPNFLAAATYIRNLLDGKSFNWAAMCGLAMLCLGSRREMHDIHLVYEDRDYNRLKTKLEHDQRVRLPKGMNSLFPIKLLLGTGPRYKDAGCTENIEVEVNLVPPGSHGAPQNDVLRQNQVLLRANINGNLVTFKGLNMQYLVKTLLHYSRSQDLTWDPKLDIAFLCISYAQEVSSIRQQLNQGELYDCFFSTRFFSVDLIPTEQRKCALALLGTEHIPTARRIVPKGQVLSPPVGDLRTTITPPMDTGYSVGAQSQPNPIYPPGTSGACGSRPVGSHDSSNYFSYQGQNGRPLLVPGQAMRPSSMDSRLPAQMNSGRPVVSVRPNSFQDTASTRNQQGKQAYRAEPISTAVNHGPHASNGSPPFSGKGPVPIYAHNTSQMSNAEIKPHRHSSQPVPVQWNSQVNASQGNSFQSVNSQESNRPRQGGPNYTHAVGRPVLAPGVPAGHPGFQQSGNGKELPTLPSASTKPMCVQQGNQSASHQHHAATLSNMSTTSRSLSGPASVRRPVSSDQAHAPFIKSKSVKEVILPNNDNADYLDHPIPITSSRSRLSSNPSSTPHRLAMKDSFEEDRQKPLHVVNPDPPVEPTLTLVPRLVNPESMGTSYPGTLPPTIPELRARLNAGAVQNQSRPEPQMQNGPISSQQKAYKPYQPGSQGDLPMPLKIYGSVGHTQKQAPISRQDYNPTTQKFTPDSGYGLPSSLNIGGTKASPPSKAVNPVPTSQSQISWSTDMGAGKYTAYQPYQPSIRDQSRNPISQTDELRPKAEAAINIHELSSSAITQPHSPSDASSSPIHVGDSPQHITFITDYNYFEPQHPPQTSSNVHELPSAPAACLTPPLSASLPSPPQKSAEPETQKSFEVAGQRTPRSPRSPIPLTLVVPSPQSGPVVEITGQKAEEQSANTVSSQADFDAMVKALNDAIENAGKGPQPRDIQTAATDFSYSSIQWETDDEEEERDVKNAYVEFGYWQHNRNPWSASSEHEEQSPLTGGVESKGGGQWKEEKGKDAVTMKKSWGHQDYSGDAYGDEFDNDAGFIPGQRGEIVYN